MPSVRKADPTGRQCVGDLYDHAKINAEQPDQETAHGIRSWLAWRDAHVEGTR
jgi:hypothetical protein